MKQAKLEISTKVTPRRLNLQLTYLPMFHYIYILLTFGLLDPLVGLTFSEFPTIGWKPSNIPLTPVNILVNRSQIGSGLSTTNMVTKFRYSTLYGPSESEQAHILCTSSTDKPLHNLSRQKQHLRSLLSVYIEVFQT